MFSIGPTVTELTRLPPLLRTSTKVRASVVVFRLNTATARSCCLPTMKPPVMPGRPVEEYQPFKEISWILCNQG